MVEISDKIEIENFLFINKSVSNILLPIFNSWFVFSFISHDCETSFATKFHLQIPTAAVTTYSKGTFMNMATKACNNIQSQIKDPVIDTFSPNKPKISIFDF